MVEISNCDFTFGSFGQESTLDIVHAIPIKTVKPKIEGCTVKIGQITCSFNTIKSETCYDDSFSFLDSKTKAEKYKTEKYSKNIPPSTNQFRRSRLELGNLLSLILVSSPAATVECVDLVSAKASELRSFIFDPGGESKHNVVKGCIALNNNFTTALSLSEVIVLVLFPSCIDAFIFNFRDSLHVVSDLDMTLVFDPGGNFIIFSIPVVSVSFASFLQMIVFLSSTNSNSVKPEEHPVVIFDPGGKSIASSSPLASSFSSWVYVFVLQIVRPTKRDCWLSLLRRRETFFREREQRDEMNDSECSLCSRSRSFQALPVYIGNGLQSCVLCGLLLFGSSFFLAHYSRTGSELVDVRILL